MLNLHQKQSLQQKLSPQQIQYIKLLQLPTLALEQRIKAEIEANPLLEEGEELDEDAPLTDEEPAETPAAEAAADEPAEERNRDDEFDWDEFLNAPDDLYGYKAQVDHSAEEDDRELPMPSAPSLAERLGEQVGLLGLTETEQLVAEQIIGSIDEDGYLRRPVESILDDVMFNFGVMLTEEDVERVLARVQRLDPVGIAARDLRECLLVQLDAMPPETPGRAHALAMLRDAYKAFTMKHFDQIMRRLGIDEAELKEAYDLVRSLDPKPGEGAFTAQVNYVTPDFTVERVGEEFRIALNGRNAPELRINRHYRDMWNRLSADGRRGNPEADETKQFLKTRMESARWFIHSINQRRQTMLRVMEAIVTLQEPFFTHGEGHLRPMILKDIADIIKMDISTVSRVVSGKYVQTEYGVYELKYFFSEGITTEDGEEVSNKEVKALLERIIGEEDKARPLSDQRLAELLDEQGFNIARRTVTKYREQLGIPVARLRRQIVLDG
ncbi:MAG: RNA polymerase factor sigma-54 [Rubricoccaceae bacterium]